MLDRLEKYDLLPWLINTYNCKIGVEVGVRDGSNAKNLLEKTKMTLVGVDIYVYPQIQGIIESCNGRFSLYNGYSIRMSEYFGEESLDWIYLDAGHTYPDVSADIEAWWPKLKTGGIFCGDDYCNCWNPQEGLYEVVRAIEEFIEDKDIVLHISGIGVVDKQTRLDYANKIGKLHEDNFTGRKRTEDVPVPQWWFIKG